MGAVSPNYIPLVSPNFSLKEVECKCGCGYYAINDSLVYRLEVLRGRLGHKPIAVHSWCRCEKHNRAVGGVEKSYHIYGMAVDVSVPGVDLATIAKVAGEFFDGIGIYWRQGFVHLDIRGWQARWQE